jgi:hypothetical protein
MDIDAPQDCVLASSVAEESLAAVGHETLEMPAAVREFARERALEPYRVEVCARPYFCMYGTLWDLSMKTALCLWLPPTSYS